MHPNVDSCAKPLRLVISAGESSGDFLAARLVSQLREIYPNLEVSGIAGPLMRDAGVQAWFDMDELNVMGLQEVLRHLPRLFRLRRAFMQRVLDWQPDAFIGVDAPDFNLGLARALKSNGIETFHYVSPSVWAWRPKRAVKISHSIDHLLTLFPFEPPLFTRHGLDAVFVGHPMADEIQSQLANTARASTDNERKLLLLPGSRSGELRRHVRLALETARELRKIHPTLKVQMSLVSHTHEHWARTRFDLELQDLNIELLVGQTREALAQADLALSASGTVSLETFMMDVPQVVFYRLAPITYWLARSLKLVKSKWIALPNILSKKDLVPELIQDQATPSQLAHALNQWIEEPERVTAYREEASCLREELLAQDRAARALLSRLHD